MDISAIASVSTDMKLMKVQQAVDISLTKKVLDSQETQMTNLIDQMMPQTPSFGHLLDVTV